MKLHIINIQNDPNFPAAISRYQHTLGVDSVHEDSHRCANQ